jgi:hypothetical protein
MHARYVFHYNDGNLEDAAGAFRDWIRQNGDGNNWSELMLGINSEGDVTRWASDYRGLDERTEQLLGEYETYDGFRRYAWELAAHEAFSMDRLSFDDKEERVENVETAIKNINDLSLNEIPQWFQNTLGATLSNTAAELHSDGRATDIDQLSKKARAMKNGYLLLEEISRAKKMDRSVAPFRTCGTPYNGRCFQLGGYPIDSTGETIVVADIHT